MLNLGGSVLGFHSADSSSASKGESVSDTIRVISCYADICAMRHPKEGAPLVASEKSRIPVINAGEISTILTLSYLMSALISECTVRPNFKSPQKPIVILFNLPLMERIVRRSASVWVGC